MSLQCRQQEYQSRCGVGNYLEKGNEDAQKKLTNEPSPERHKPQQIKKKDLQRMATDRKKDGADCTLCCVSDGSGRETLTGCVVLHCVSEDTEREKE